MSDQISVCVSVDIPVGFVEKAVKDLSHAAQESEEVLEREKEVFQSLDASILESGILEYLRRNYRQGKRFAVGDEVYFIRDGAACHDKISDAIFFFEGGGVGKNERELFRSMDELVEHLKKSVHG